MRRLPLLALLACGRPVEQTAGYVDGRLTLNLSEDEHLTGFVIAARQVTDDTHLADLVFNVNRQFLQLSSNRYSAFCVKPGMYLPHDGSPVDEHGCIGWNNTWDPDRADVLVRGTAGELYQLHVVETEGPREYRYGRIVLDLTAASAGTPPP